MKKNRITFNFPVDAGQTECPRDYAPTYIVSLAAIDEDGKMFMITDRQSSALDIPSTIITSYNTPDDVVAQLLETITRSKEFEAELVAISWSSVEGNVVKNFVYQLTRFKRLPSSTLMYRAFANYHNDNKRRTVTGRYIDPKTLPRAVPMTSRLLAATALLPVEDVVTTYDSALATDTIELCPPEVQAYAALKKLNYGLYGKSFTPDLLRRIAQTTPVNRLTMNGLRAAASVIHDLEVFRFNKSNNGEVDLDPTGKLFTVLPIEIADSLEGIHHLESNNTIDCGRCLIPLEPIQ